MNELDKFMPCIDASVFVSAINRKEKYFEQSRNLLKQIRAEGTRVLLPEIILPEITSAIVRATKNPTLAKEVVNALKATPNFSFVPIDRNISNLAIEIITETGLKSADSIYVALAAAYNLELITLDQEQLSKGKSFVVVRKP
ncbi:MAG: type II toxin-antitoxin system VapC family toxin [Parcubacteria group bacterium]|nr:type II toxin-antitoxin system VapC family toxin [Parcubacteria group bacterium]